MNHTHETIIAGRPMKVEFGKLGMLSDLRYINELW